MDEDALGLQGIEEPLDGVDRTGLVLERESEPRYVIDEGAARRERIVAEAVLEELDDLELKRERLVDLDAEWRRRVRRGAGDPVVGVRQAARRRAGDGPSIHRVAIVFERRRAGAGRDDDVVDEDARSLEDVITRVGDRHLDRRAGVRSEVDAPVLPAVTGPADGIPLARRAGRIASRVVVRGLVVLEERCSACQPGQEKPVSREVWPF